MRTLKPLVIDLVVLLIITVPAFLSLLNNQYFSMHDDQHIVRLFLFDQGIKQGQLYPRWVDGLGFGYGYPLFNFYPPMIYFVSEIFHLLGFSFIWSIKLLVISGYFIAALGIYLLIKELLNKSAAYVGAVLYTYFFYHAVTAYVRGALAEFFSIAVLPWVLYMMFLIAKKPTYLRIVGLAITVAILLLSHPLISFPSLFYMGVCGLFFMYTARTYIIRYSSYLTVALLLGASLSSFFWLPSLAEKKYIMVDDILTTELANYKIHYVYPYQFLYSSWGYGGSGPGLNDGMTFQLGKIHMLLAICAAAMSFIYMFYKKDKKSILFHFWVWFGLLLFSIFMCTEYSSFIWDNVTFLWYLQFPWRYLTFVGLFISMVGAYNIEFIKEVIPHIHLRLPLSNQHIIGVVVTCISISTIGGYSKYFKPQILRNVTDAQLTSDEEVKWRISKTSFEFVPKGIRTKKSTLNTTILDIEKNQVQTIPYAALNGNATVIVLQNTFSNKVFNTTSNTPFVFRLNTYTFPGWSAYIDNTQTVFTDSNALKLMEVRVPQGSHTVAFRFVDTPVRKLSNILSLLSLLCCVSLLYIGKKRTKHIIYEG